MENVIVEKSFDFAVMIVKLTRRLKEQGVEHSLINQLLRSGTSIGANVEEAQDAQSKNDFIAKMSIALKEAREARYWLKILKETDNFSDDELSNYLEEIIRILTKILKTSKAN